MHNEKEADRQRPKSVGLYRARNSFCPNDIFGVKVINQYQCKKRRKVEKKIFSLEDLSSIMDAVEDLKGHDLLKEVQKIVSVLKNIERKKMNEKQCNIPFLHLLSFYTNIHDFFGSNTCCFVYKGTSV